MNKQVIVSAPGKLMLFGEHAVIYHHPCLVTAVNQRMQITADILDTREFRLEAEGVNITDYKKPLSKVGKGTIPKGAQFVEIAIKNIAEAYSLSSGLRIVTHSEFSSAFGFGSSSAVSVCTIKAVSELFGLSLSQKAIFNLAYKTVLDVQSTGSGFDIAAAIYGGMLYFVTGGEIIEPLSIATFPLVVGYSGIKADTVTLVQYVHEECKKHPDMTQHIFANIEALVTRAKTAMLAKQWSVVGELMNTSQEYLDALGVSTKKLDDMIYAARKAGAYGAKLSGAGGGDCIIAIAPEERRLAVEEAIIHAGGKILAIKTNAQGVRIEKNE